MDQYLYEQKDLVIDTPRILLPVLEPARYKGLHGGRGSMKSHFFAELMVEEAMVMEDYRAVCIREIQKSLNQSVKLLIEDKIKKFGVQRYFKIRDSWIETPGDGVIIFQGMQNHTADSIKSLEGYKRAWFEEAQNMSQTSFDLLRPTIRAPGSQLWFSWNPRFQTDPVDKFFRGKNVHPSMICMEINFMHNPWFPEELRVEMLYDKATDPDKYKHIWLGGYLVHSEARVFKRYRLGSHEEIEEAIKQAGVKRLQGADWGYAADPNVGVVIYVNVRERKIYVRYEAYKIKVELEDTPDFFRQIPDFEKWSTVADSARPETISYMQRHGFPRFKSAVKGPNSVLEGIEFLKSFEIIVHPECEHTYDELNFYQWEVDPDTNLVLPVLGQKKNHVIDSMRYAIEPLRRPQAGML